jgi:hypothetical protein
MQTIKQVLQLLSVDMLTSVISPIATLVYEIESISRIH